MLISVLELVGVQVGEERDEVRLLTSRMASLYI